jgi:hypothetical protein
MELMARDGSAKSERMLDPRLTHYMVMKHGRCKVSGNRNKKP